MIVDGRRDIRRVILGLQGSGKSVLARHFVNGYSRRGVKPLVIDYMNEYDGVGHTAFRINDRVIPQLEVEYALHTLIIEPKAKGLPLSKRYGLLVCDEAPRYFPTKKPLPPAMAEINDVGRHYGLATICVGRRAVQMHTDITELAHRIYLFRQTGINDLKRCDEWKENLSDIVRDLKPYHFIELNMESGEVLLHRPLPLPTKKKR